MDDIILSLHIKTFCLKSLLYYKDMVIASYFPAKLRIIIIIIRTKCLVSFQNFIILSL